MPKRFEAELKELKKKLVTMGDTAQSMFLTAMNALTSRDGSLIPAIHESEDEVDRLQVAIDEDVMRLVTVYGPVAMDLRFVLMVARINTELERVGDQAVNMCEHVQLLLSEPELKKLVDLPRMAEVAARMIRESLQAFNDGSTSRAREVIKADDEVDALNNQLFRELLTYMMSDTKNVPRALALLLIARSLERIADHATNMAEEVIYLVKGEDVRHPDAMREEEG